MKHQLIVARERQMAELNDNRKRIVPLMYDMTRTLHSAGVTDEDTVSSSKKAQAAIHELRPPIHYVQYVTAETPSHQSVAARMPAPTAAGRLP